MIHVIQKWNTFFNPIFSARQIPVDNVCSKYIFKILLVFYKMKKSIKLCPFMNHINFNIQQIVL
jgi:hypothetical protein